MRPFRVVVVAVLVLSIASAAPPEASAGTYTVRQCDYAAGNGFHDFGWQAAGSPGIALYAGSGCGEFGLAARNGNVGSEQRYPSGGYGGWYAYAPTGTVITRFSGAFGTIMGCCVNGMAPYAEAYGTTGRAYLFQGSLGNDSWYAPSGLQGPQGRSWQASASGFDARSVGFFLRCGPGFSCYQNPTGDFRLRGRSFDFTLRDDSPPWVGDVSGSLVAGGWLRGAQTLTAHAGDVGGGLTGVNASFDNGTTLTAPASCTIVSGRYARLQPCPLAHSGAWTVDTAKLPDGARRLALWTADVGGAAVERIHSLKVDNTAPAAPIAATVRGGSGWRNGNGFALDWTNPRGQHAPIAHARFRACPVGGGTCLAGERSANDIASAAFELPEAGEWDVRVWLADAAGNSDSAHASPPQRLRYDPEPPALRFAEPDPDAPTKVAVAASDRSGIAGGQIELRPHHGGDWQPLPTAVSGDTLTTSIDDSARRGAFELRAHAVDLAGNRAVLLGPARTLPLRAATRLDVAIGKRSALRARYGTRVTVDGALLTAAGNPIVGQAIAVTAVSGDRTERLADVRTDSAGRLAFALRARRSAAFRLSFKGDARTLPASGQVDLVVPAPATIGASRRLLRGSGRTVFRGRVRGGSIPVRGKLVEIQAHFRGRWRTISAVRTGPDGRWRFGYAFRSTPRPTTYRLRARVPGEAGYPFAAGTSRPVRVTVLPR